jgi:Holliday junction resolvase RusA-like endonuclease
VGHKRVLSQAGKDYRKLVGLILLEQGITERLGDMRLGAEFHAYPPTECVLDLDNRLKAPLDALQAARLFDSDSQFDWLQIHRGPKPQTILEIVLGKP